MAGGIYIHVPFCKKRCVYCDFVSQIYDSELANSYLDALCAEIEIRKNKSFEANTIYFGGGTPSVVDFGWIDTVLEKLAKNYSLSSNTEITIECNPESVTPQKAAAWRAMGINRASVGVQSLDDNELAWCGRIHNSKMARQAVECLHDAGFKNISCDLIIGLMGQSKQSIINSVNGLECQHLSIYGLKCEKNTPLWNSGFRENDDEIASLYEIAANAAQRRGFCRYEISNFAHAGFESRHNLKYWRLAPYMGFGLAAHSFNGKMRSWNTSNMASYLKRELEGGAEELTQKSLRTERIMLSLRLKEGLNLADFEKEFGEDLLQTKGKEVNRLLGYGIIALENGALRLNDDWMYRENTVLMELI